MTEQRKQHVNKLHNFTRTAPWATLKMHWSPNALTGSYFYHRKSTLLAEKQQGMFNLHIELANYQRIGNPTNTGEQLHELYIFIDH